MARKRSFLQNCMTNLRQIFPLFAAMFSGDSADGEAPGDGSCKYEVLSHDAVS